MANNKNNGGASMYPYGNNPSQQTTDAEEKYKTVAIFLPVFIVVVLLLRLLCFWVHKDSDEEDVVVAGAGNRVRHQQRRSSEAGGWADRAPPSTVAGAAVEAVSPVRAAEPPLVCTYRKADGWREGSCGVCLADMDDGEAVRVLPVCMHYFHAACVGEWLRGHDTCPLCRAPLVSPAAAA